MIDRVRDYFRDEAIGVTIPVGVVVGLALSALLRTAYLYVLTPLLAQTALGDEEDFGAFGFNDLDFNIGDATIAYGIPLVDLLTLASIAAIAWWLFVRPTRVELDAVADRQRECPECKSLIVVGASRCPFCTAQIAPLVADG